MYPVTNTSLKKNLDRSMLRHTHLLQIEELRSRYEAQMIDYIEKYVSCSPRIDMEFSIARNEIVLAVVPENSSLYLDVLLEIIKYEHFYSDGDLVRKNYSELVRHGLAGEINSDDCEVAE